MIQAAISYKRYRRPPSVIAHAVWLYVRFPLSLRLVEEMLLERGIVVSYETVAFDAAYVCVVWTGILIMAILGLGLTVLFKTRTTDGEPGQPFV